MEPEQLLQEMQELKHQVQLLNHHMQTLTRSVVSFGQHRDLSRKERSAGGFGPNNNQGIDITQTLRVNTSTPTLTWLLKFSVPVSGAAYGAMMFIYYLADSFEEIGRKGQTGGVNDLGDVSVNNIESQGQDLIVSAWQLSSLFDLGDDYYYQANLFQTLQLGPSTVEYNFACPGEPNGFVITESTLNS